MAMDMPAWCGACDEHTRRFNLGDVERRCPDCHPYWAFGHHSVDPSRVPGTRAEQEQAQRRLALHRPGSPDAVRGLAAPLVGFSAQMRPAVAGLREFLHARMYRHYKVNRMALKARRIVRELVETLIEAPECLPDGWREAAGSPGSRATAEAVRDYIAGMTDRFALDEHDRLYKLARDRT